MHLPGPSLQRLNRSAALALWTVLGIWGVLALASVFLMSLGTDEAWVLNGLRSLLRPTIPHLSTELIMTNGGPFALLNLGAEALLGGRLWAHRLISAAAMTGACVLVLRQRRIDARTPGTYLLGFAVLLAVPGIAEIGTAALGTSVGLFLMLASMVAWTSAATPTWSRVLFGGMLYGLAAASRFDLVLFGPAVLLVASFRTPASGGLELRLDVPALQFVAIGLAVFLGNLWVMSFAASTLSAAATGDVTGLTRWTIDYPTLFNQWRALAAFVSPALLAILAIGSLWIGNRRTTEFEKLLLTTGVVLLLSWLLRAPIPHLRYALPGLFCVVAAGALALQRLASLQIESGAARQLLLCQCLCIVAAIGGVASLARSVVMSDSDYVSWEWSQEMASDYFRRFEAQSDQRRVAEHLRTRIDPAARVYSAVPFALRYLSERPIVDLGAIDADAAASRIEFPKRFLVLTPATGSYFHLTQQSASWLLDNSSMVAQFGRYSIYELKPGTDRDMKNLMFVRGNYLAHPGSQPWFGRK